MPAGADPGNVRQIESARLSDADVAALLRGVTLSQPFGPDDADDFRISIAGAQEKTALLRRDGHWHRPHGATPTTHFLKLPLGLVGNMRADMRDSVENEWLCMEFLRGLGLPVANVSITRFCDNVSEEKALIVERFDRELVPATTREPEWILRLPQEDFCQATGTHAQEKYESHGGPGIRESLALLATGERAREDALVFAKAQLAFWPLAAPDGHEELLRLPASWRWLPHDAASTMCSRRGPSLATARKSGHIKRCIWRWDCAEKATASPAESSRCSILANSGASDWAARRFRADGLGGGRGRARDCERAGHEGSAAPCWLRRKRDSRLILRMVAFSPLCVPDISSHGQPALYRRDSIGARGD